MLYINLILQKSFQPIRDYLQLYYWYNWEWFQKLSWRSKFFSQITAAVLLLLIWKILKINLLLFVKYSLRYVVNSVNIFQSIKSMWWHILKLKYGVTPSCRTNIHSHHFSLYRKPLYNIVIKFPQNCM